MKKKLLILFFALALNFSFAQETTVNLSLGAGYANEVYYKLSSQTETIFDASSWDVAFLRTDPFNHGVRINDGIGTLVFEASNNPADWNSIDINDEALWTPLYNDDTNWDNGAFMQGSATFGWGEYNPVNHHIEGAIIFVLKYTNGTYRKFFIEDYFDEYTFRYATWNGSNWVNEQTVTIDNANNPNNRYNYYSLEDDQEVVAEPALADWDFVFRKYDTFLDPPGQYYNVTGTLQNPTVTVAQNEETGSADPNGLTYSEEINIIGYDWKEFTGSWTVYSDQKYYVRYADNSVYRLYFTDFGGSTTGNLTMVFEDVSDLLGFEEVAEGVSFGMYPNPSNGMVNIIYDVTSSSDSNGIEVYNLAGSKVYSAEANSANGFYNKTLNLSELSSGVYLVTFTSGTQTVTKKLIIK